MLARTTRWMTAGLLAAAAVLAAPARSEAGTQILIEEVTVVGNLVTVVPGTTQVFNSNSVSYSTPNFLDIAVNANAGTGAVSSLTTTVNARPNIGFDGTYQLRLVVTNDGYVNPFPGGTGVVTNNAGASSAIGNGQNAVSNQTQLLAEPLNPPTSSGDLAGGASIGPATDVATDIRPSAQPAAQTTANVPLVPANFAIQQTIYVRAILDPTSEAIASGSTLGGTASSVVFTSAAPSVVPAPAGVVLALVGLPVLGLRRALRKKATA